MPVTKTAKRALKASERKADTNKVILTRLDTAIRIAKKDKSKKQIAIASSYTDRASKKGLIHKNKAARIKSQLSKLVPTKSKTKVVKTKKKSK